MTTFIRIFLFIFQFLLVSRAPKWERICFTWFLNVIPFSAMTRSRAGNGSASTNGDSRRETLSEIERAQNKGRGAARPTAFRASNRRLFELPCTLSLRAECNDARALRENLRLSSAWKKREEWENAKCKDSSLTFFLLSLSLYMLSRRKEGGMRIFWPFYCILRLSFSFIFLSPVAFVSQPWLWIWAYQTIGKASLSSNILTKWK